MANSGPSGLVQMAARWALNAVMPPLCPLCRSPLGGQDGLCAECWVKLNFIAPPFCDACGTPLPFSIGPGQPCAACTEHTGAVVRVRAATVYDEGSKALILPLKHADRLDLAPLMARLMASAGRTVLEGADYLVPVPSHWTRLLSRRANQAAELCRALSQRTGVAYAPWALARARRTALQGTHGGVKGRLANVHGAFQVSSRAARQISRKRLVIVDDVWTTGATVNACGAALLASGAAQVSAITFARVVRPAQLDL